MSKKEFSILDALVFETSVSQSRIRLNDKRTGEIIEVVLCHPGDYYPQKRLQKVCEDYGFGLISCDVIETTSGILEWNDIFSALVIKEKYYDRPELQTKTAA